MPTQHAQLPGFKFLPCPSLPARQKKAPSSNCAKQVIMGDLMPGVKEVATEAALCLLSRLGELPVLKIGMDPVSVPGLMR